MFVDIWVCKSDNNDLADFMNEHIEGMFDKDPFLQSEKLLQRFDEHTL